MCLLLRTHFIHPIPPFLLLAEISLAVGESFCWLHYDGDEASNHVFPLLLFRFTCERQSIFLMASEVR